MAETEVEAVPEEEEARGLIGADGAPVITRGLVIGHSSSESVLSLGCC